MNQERVMEEKIIIELQNWKNRFAELFQLLDQAEGKDAIKAVSNGYLQLKEDILQREKELRKSEAKGSLSTTEQTILAPAIREAALHCSAPKGSTNKQKLSSSLYDGEDYLSCYLGQLNA